MNTRGRYEIREVLGEGGMGIVSRAFDPVMNRDVTVKTIRDPQDKAVLELFKRECAVLASITHPNIVEIYDIGEIEEAGGKRPYFVMPLLPGVTLQELIKTSSPRLTVERSVQMIGQVCRGLQAAHDQGLIHRDLKPSNLFVLPDDSVKIIDFGMAHLANHRSATGLKGTLLYMAPEQLQMNQPTFLSDQFSLAVVCYEMLARRHPFSGAGQEDLARAILGYTPPPVSEFNPLVSTTISQVIHKALAKQPFHRFSDVRQFADCLQKALRGEPIDIFDPARIAPRLQQAREAFELGDFDDAAEIVTGLEAEYPAPEIVDLRKQIEDVRRAKTVKQLLETARRLLDKEDYMRALQKVQDVLNLDPANSDAFTLRGRIDSKRSTTQIEEWFRLANEHMENHAYTHARQALEKVLDLLPKEVRALTLLAEVDRREQEHMRLRNERQQAYQSALDAYNRGDVNSALNKLERLLDLDRRALYSSSPDQGAPYQRLYEEVRSKRDQLSSQEAEARHHLNQGNFPAARAICDDVLAVYPNNVVFCALRDDVEQAQRLELSSYLAKIEREVAAELDFNRKVSLLEEAKLRYPSEPGFEQSLQQVRARRDMVDSIAGRARTFEEARQFSDALGQWEMLRRIYPQYPGLDIEIDRLRKRREQQSRADAKAHWVTQIDQALAVHNHAKATSLAADALVEFPGDAEVSSLAKQVQLAQKRTFEAEEKANRGKELHGGGNPKEAVGLLREAFELDPHNPVVRSGLIETLLKEASRHVDEDWRAAESLIRDALDLDPNNQLAKSLGTLIEDKRQAEDVSAALSKARELRAQGDTRGAITELDKVRDLYPRESRLVQLRALLIESLSTRDREELRARDLEELNKLAWESKKTRDLRELESIFQKTGAFSKYSDDAEFRGPISAIEEQLRNEQEAVKVTADTSTVPSPGVSEQTAPYQVALQGAEERTRAEHGFRRRRVPRALWPIVGFSIVALALIVGIRHLKPPPPPPPQRVHVAFQVNVEGATISVDNQVLSGAVEDLRPGSHTVSVVKTGYKTLVRLFSVDREPSPVVLTLEPEPDAIRISADLRAGSVFLDGAEKGVLNDGNFSYDLPSGGKHTLKLLDGRNEILSIEFQADPGAPARLLAPPSARDIPVTVVSSLGSSALVHSSVPGMRATLNHADPQTIPPEGRELALLPVNNEVTFDDGKKPVDVPVETGNAPVLSIRAGSANRGTLQITANVDDARVFINGRLSPLHVQHGKWQQTLPPAEYSIRLTLDGYDDTPEQKLAIAAGKAITAPFELKRSVTMTFLQIQGGTPDAEVWLGGRLVGNLDSNGSFGPTAVTPEVDHSIQFKKEYYEPSTELKRHAPVKQAILISGSEAQLKPFGTLVFADVQPPDAQVTIQGRGVTSPLRVTGKMLRLVEGPYKVRGTADQYEPYERDVQVVSGGTDQIQVVLKRKEGPLPIVIPPPPAAVPSPPKEVTELFGDDPKNWTHNDHGFWIHDGTTWIKERYFTHVFEVLRIKKRFGTEKVSWRIFLHGEDYIEFELDDRNLRRREWQGGKPKDWVSKPHSAGQGEFYRLEITLQPDQVIHKIGPIGKQMTDNVPLKVEGQTGFAGKFGLRLAE